MAGQKVKRITRVPWRGGAKVVPVVTLTLFTAPKSRDTGNLSLFGIGGRGVGLFDTVEDVAEFDAHIEVHGLAEAEDAADGEALKRATLIAVIAVVCCAGAELPAAGSDHVAGFSTKSVP